VSWVDWSRAAAEREPAGVQRAAGAAAPASIPCSAAARFFLPGDIQWLTPGRGGDDRAGLAGGVRQVSRRAPGTGGAISEPDPAPATRLTDNQAPDCCSNAGAEADRVQLFCPSPGSAANGRSSSTPPTRRASAPPTRRRSPRWRVTGRGRHRVDVSEA